MPITAVYIILAATLVKPLVSMGAEPLSAHMFIFLFAAVAGLTPPVAITSYTAAGIAKTSPTEVAVRGFIYGLPGYIIPFIFVFSPELLMVGTPLSIILAIITAIFGICCLVAAIEGYFLGKWSAFSRVLLFGLAILLLKPGFLSDLTAAGIVTLLFLGRWLMNKKKMTKTV